MSKAYKPIPKNNISTSPCIGSWINFADTPACLAIASAIFFVLPDFE
jgi:hypothetical protein